MKYNTRSYNKVLYRESASTGRLNCAVYNGSDPEEFNPILFVILHCDHSASVERCNLTNIFMLLADARDFGLVAAHFLPLGVELLEKRLAYISKYL